MENIETGVEIVEYSTICCDPCTAGHTLAVLQLTWPKLSKDINYMNSRCKPQAIKSSGALHGSNSLIQQNTFFGSIRQRLFQMFQASRVQMRAMKRWPCWDPWDPWDPGWPRQLVLSTTLTTNLMVACKGGHLDVESTFAFQFLLVVKLFVFFLILDP